MFGTTLNPSEMLSLALCFLALLYVLANKRVLLRGKYAFFTYGFLCVAGGYFLTNLEEFFLEDLLNIVEHSLTAAGALYVAIGSRRLYVSEKGKGGGAP